jgi:glycosyltransferase involved in cell wall biosynthesis
MIKALISHGELGYTFEVNDSQADLLEIFPASERAQYMRSLREAMPWTTWFDGTHPRFRLLDSIRDWTYRRLCGGRSLYRFQFGRAVQRIGADVCHYPFQDLPFFPRQRGLIYTQVAHDFRQEYLPELETRESLGRLRADYQGYRGASALCVLGETCKQDAIRFAGLGPERVFVTPYGPWEVPPPASAQVQDRLRKRFKLPNEFLFYPAPTRVHKNHVRLIRALAVLKKKGCRIPLVTTGKEQPYFDLLWNTIGELGIRDDVIFTDYLDLPTLYALYDMATGVVLPTLFEGATGIPLLEALSKGKPIAAARVCEIPNALGESGLLFDPYSEAEIAAAVQRLWESPPLRAELSSKARQTNRGRSWEQFAKATEAAFLYAHDHPAT